MRGNMRRVANIDERILVIHRACNLLLKFEGCQREVFKQMAIEGYTITAQSINSIKHKTNWAEISDEYFDDFTFEEMKKHNIITETTISEVASDKKQIEVINKICELLLKFDGDADMVADQMDLDGQFITVNTVNAIKHKIKWTDISDNYFDYNTFKRTALSHSLICGLLIKHKGSAIKVLGELVAEFPDIQYAYIERVKTGYLIKDINFDTKQLSPRLDVKAVQAICESLIKHRGSVNQVFDELHDRYDNISRCKINSIIYKQCWLKISDKYFKKGAFKNTKRNEGLINYEY